MAVQAFQENIRNKGWRIKRIPWKQNGKAEWVHNSPLSGILVLLGLALFLVPALPFFVTGSWAQHVTRMLASFSQDDRAQKAVVIILMVSGLGVLMLSRVVAARSKFRGWVAVPATCIDYEIRERKRKRRRAGSTRWHTLWKLRTLCTFDYDGRQWQVTPECYHEFASEKRMTEYVAEVLGQEGRCTLHINPKNPLQAALHEVPRIVTVSNDAGNP